MKVKVVIFEGPDRVGKSTQVKLLFEEFCGRDELVHQLHYSGVKLPKDDCIRYSKNLYSSMFNIVHKNRFFANFILDRSHLGEYVYGNLYRGYEANWVFDLEADMRDRDPKWFDASFYLITMVLDPKKLVAREDGESFSTDLEKKETEILRFKEAHTRSNVSHKLLLDCDHTPEVLAQTIKDFVWS